MNVLPKNLGQWLPLKAPLQLTQTQRSPVRREKQRNPYDASACSHSTNLPLLLGAKLTSGASEQVLPSHLTTVPGQTPVPSTPQLGNG
jgi:hypothetical protein